MQFYSNMQNMSEMQNALEISGFRQKKYEIGEWVLHLSVVSNKMKANHRKEDSYG